MSDKNFEDVLRRRLADAADLAPTKLGAPKLGAEPLTVRDRAQPGARRPRAWLIATAVALALVLAVAAVVVVQRVLSLPSWSPGNGAASCVGTIEFDGVLYDNLFVERIPRPGDQIGQGLSLVCNDTNHPNPADQDLPVTVHPVPGIDPAIAIIVDSAVYIARGPYQRPPAELAALREPLTCTTAGTIAGQSLGLEAVVDPGTAPRLYVRVDAGYPLGEEWARAFLMITLTPAQATPFEDPTLQAPRVRVTVHCEDGAFIAESVERM